MSSEAKIIIKFLLKRSGKEKLKKTEIYLPLSIELGWFSTKESKQFLEYALENKFINEKDGYFSPNFDIEKINIPTGFIPSKKSYIVEKNKIKKNDEKDIITDIIKQIMEKTNKNEQDIIEEINRKEDEKNILTDIAALMVAKKYEIGIDEYFDVVENKYFS